MSIPTRTALTKSVDETLDEFHEAASNADRDAYFALLWQQKSETDSSGDGGGGFCFMGTDATERWTLLEFQKYVTHRFAQGQGWTYRPLSRNIVYHHYQPRSQQPKIKPSSLLDQGKEQSIYKSTTTNRAMEEDFSSSSTVAWFDEILQHDRFGIARSSGVVVRITNDNDNETSDNTWKIAQYHLTVPIPNPLMDSFVDMIGQLDETVNNI